MQKENKVALITGASRGIGKVVASEFAKGGYDLILIARQRKELENTKKELESFNIKVKTISCDVSNNKILRKVISSIHKIDVLINAAAVQGPIGPLVKNKPMKWIQTININLIGTYNMIQLTINKIKKGGSIINFSGGGAVLPRENFSSYAISKSGIVKLTEILAIELKSKYIKVNAISPGAINTNMFNIMLKAGKKNVGDIEWVKLMQQKKSGGNNSLNAAKLCLWLCNSSNNLTGKTISAIYDDWSRWTKSYIDKINSSDWYTMRRIDPFTINKLNKL